MDKENSAKTLAQDWAASKPELNGLEVHLVEQGKYWWASFRDAGSDQPRMGSPVLLVDVDKGKVQEFASAVGPDQAIAEYEAKS